LNGIGIGWGENPPPLHAVPLRGVCRNDTNLRKNPNAQKRPDVAKCEKTFTKGRELRRGTCQ